MPVITVNQFKGGLLDPQQLVDDVNANPGVYFLTIRAKILPSKMRKGKKDNPNPYFGRVHKIVCANGMIGANYEKAVNKQLEKRGETPDFVAGEHVWADYVNEYLATKKDDSSKRYIRFIERSRKEYWFLDGRMVDKNMFSEWMPEDKEEIVKFRNFTVDNILSIKWHKRTYVITERHPHHEFPR